MAGSWQQAAGRRADKEFHSQCSFILYIPLDLELQYGENWGKGSPQGVWGFLILISYQKSSSRTFSSKSVQQYLLNEVLLVYRAGFQFLWRLQCMPRKLGFRSHKPDSNLGLINYSLCDLGQISSHHISPWKNRNNNCSSSLSFVRMRHW